MKTAVTMITIPVEKYAESLYRVLHTANHQVASPESCRQAILLCKKAMKKLKTQVNGLAFPDPQSEIRFFKDIKPRFYSRYIYLVSIYNYLTQQPPGSENARRSYINEHLADLERFFAHNKAFYQYYRSGNTQLDDIYFTRGAFHVHVELEDFEEDERYATSHDYKLSKIMANEKFQDYLRQELARIGNEEFSSLGKVFPYKHPQWTASQTDAIELLYALKTGLAVNNGKVDITELVAIWEFVFQMEIKDSYHKMLDITRRKKELFVFMNRLTESFMNFIRDKFK